VTGFIPFRATRFAAAAAVFWLTIAPASHARDYGQHGAVFPIVEPDFLRVIETRLRDAEASGQTAAMNKRLVDRTKQMVRRPTPVAGITRASQPRSWLYDPSITTSSDVRDHKGRLIFAAGTRVNPLEKVAMRRSMVFLNGDDPEQVAWALKSTTASNAILVLTGGDVFAHMKSAQRRFFFDQGGDLTAKFGIRHVPAVVQQEGLALRVSEVVPGTPSAARAAPVGKAGARK
jgi:conjugal transfer pilus assembly protein TraW